MLGNLTGWHFLILLAVILLVFGAAKLPALAKSMGQSARVFKGEIKAMKEEDAATAAPRRHEHRGPAAHRRSRRRRRTRECTGAQLGCRRHQALIRR